MREKEMIQFRYFKSLSITNTISNLLERSSSFFPFGGHTFFLIRYLKAYFILEVGDIAISSVMKENCLTQMKSKSFSYVGLFF